MTIVLGAVTADGHVSNEEITRLRGMSALSPIFARNSGEEDLAVLRFADNVITPLAGDAVTRAAAALSPELRETARCTVQTLERQGYRVTLERVA